MKLYWKNKKAIYPGSFDPFHHGHMEIVRFCQQELGLLVIPEISSKRFQKADRTNLEMERIAENIPLPSVIRTDSALMEDKYWEIVQVLHVPALDLIVGMDTYDRLLACYDNDQDEMLAHIGFEKIHVFPRTRYEPNTNTTAASDRIRIYTQYHGPEISSTAIRMGKASNLL